MTSREGVLTAWIGDDGFVRRFSYTVDGRSDRMLALSP